MAYRGLHIIPHDTRIDFMRHHKVTFAISVILIVGSILLIAFKGLNFGVDFAGGIRMEAEAKSGVADLTDMRAKLSEAGLGEVSLQRFGDPEDALIRLQHQDATPEDVAKATATLKAKKDPAIPADEIERRAPAEASALAQQRAIAKVGEILGEAYVIQSTEFVGPKVGQEYIENAVLASVLALFGIMAYVWFRYEWQFAVNCIVALFHDCITTVGLFALLGIQFDLTTVAAVLTIAGFSVNDTVVIYDRIREELRRYKKMPLAELLSMSINRTLSRTTMTSGLAFLAVLALYLFGGEVLRGFSIAMLWGIVVGTYSTIFVAAPMLVYMNLRRDRVAGGKPADAEQARSEA
jgi:preprotein translocase SecF subunit